MTDTLRFLVLGAAAGGGLPQWNCGCSNCVEARDPGSDLAAQTQSSLAVSVDGRQWAIFNASPDIRDQIGRNGQLHPASLRHSPISSVVITNGDVDHVAGLLTLREKQPFDLFTTAGIADILTRNPVFEVLDRDKVRRRTVALDDAFSPVPGLEARLFAVPGKVPLYMETAEPEIGIEGDQTVGVELRIGGRRAFYVPGCGSMTRKLADRLRGADLLFFDGTVFSDDEMIATGTGRKTGRRMGHMPIGGDGGSLEALAGLDIGRTIFVHINNTNPIWRKGPERAALEEQGFEVGHDGMEIALDTASG